MARRFIHLLLAFLALIPALAVAGPLKCGVYTTGDGGSFLTVARTDAALLRDGESGFQSLALRQDGSRLQVSNLEYGQDEQWTLEADDRLRSEMGQTYTLAQPADCDTTPMTPRGACSVDFSTCFEGRYEAEADTLLQWCTQERLPFACVAAMEQFQRQTDRAARNPVLDAKPPAECVESSRQFSEAACREKATQAFAQTFADTFTGLYADKLPLSDPQLDQALSFCQHTGSARVCTLAAEKLWDAGRYAVARKALNIGCEQAGDGDACRKWASLAELDPADLRVLKVDVLPCGSYAAETGLMSELDFQDRGRVEGGSGSVLRARLQDGVIRIRHDKGGDFVFGVMPGNRLLGLDSWNRYAVYQRQSGGGDRCEPPIQYTERPLPQDCPAIARDGGAAACCEAGKLQGCNAMGHARALAGDWAGAFSYYRRVCAAGVRAGCGNLTRTYAESGNEVVIESMQQLCANDARHVACDVLETSNWEMLGAAHGLQHLLQELEDAPDEDAASAPDA